MRVRLFVGVQVRMYVRILTVRAMDKTWYMVFGHPTIIRESLKWVCDFLLIHDCPLFVWVHFTVYNPKF